MHEAFKKTFPDGFEPIIETRGSNIENSNTYNDGTGQLTQDNEFDIDKFYTGLKHIVYLGAILSILMFCRFCVLWIGAEDNNYMMIDFEIPFMK